MGWDKERNETKRNVTDGRPLLAAASFLSCQGSHLSPQSLHWPNNNLRRLLDKEWGAGGQCGAIEDGDVERDKNVFYKGFRLGPQWEEFVVAILQLFLQLLLLRSSS